MVAVELHGKLENGQFEASEPMKVKMSRPDWTTTQTKHMALVGENAAAFLRELADPSPPTEHLVEAFRRHRALVGNSFDEPSE